MEQRTAGPVRTDGEPARPRHDDLGPGHRRARGRRPAHGVPEAGGTLLDTAAGYSDGESEGVLGAAARVAASPRGGGARDEGRRLPAYRRTGGRHLTPGAAATPWTGRCSRLGTDHVDLWQVHAWSDDTDLEETLSAARPRGGVRPRAVRRHLQLQRLADRPGGHAASRPRRAGRRSCRPRWSTRCCSAASSARCCLRPQRSGLGVLPWSPLGAGVLTGKYRGGTPSDSRAASPHFAALHRAVPRRPEHGGSSTPCAPRPTAWSAAPLEVALAWVRDAPGVTAPIVGRPHGGPAARVTGLGPGHAAAGDPRGARRGVRATDRLPRVVTGVGERDVSVTG